MQEDSARAKKKTEEKWEIVDMGSQKFVLLLEWALSRGAKNSFFTSGPDTFSLAISRNRANEQKRHHAAGECLAKHAKR